jgi:hypothetical protein
MTDLDDALRQLKFVEGLLQQHRDQIMADSDGEADTTVFDIAMQQLGAAISDIEDLVDAED